MLLVVHIVLAISGLLLASMAAIMPSNLRIKLSAALLGGVLLTGTVLVIATGASLVRTCFTGILYSGVMGVLIVSAKRKLAKETARSE